jgi:general L-amino acid transport system substrate-binding protein
MSDHVHYAAITGEKETMLKRSLVLMPFVLIVAVVVTLGFTSAGAQDAEVGPITQRIIDRGELICGANGAGLAGFAVVNDAGEWEGFDVDICRAVAAAVLGDANAVDFRPLNADQRQAAIQTGEIDIMSRNTTWTVSRDATWGATFAPTTFYDGQGIMVKADSGVTDLAGLEGGSICVQSGTTTELNITDALNQGGVDAELQTFADATATWEGYLSGRCDGFTTDISGLVAYQATAEDPGAHVILDLTLSKEPLGPLSPQSDPQFADIVRWTVYGLFQAEEYGITSENIDEFLASEDPGIQRFLGQGENAAGSYFGISNDFMVNVIRQVGNYGEIFDRNLGPNTPFKLERGLNALWTDGGLLYSPPFR